MLMLDVNGERLPVKTVPTHFSEVYDATKEDVAMIFGRVLGPLGKMPNPKFGAVILPKDNLKQTVEKFRKSVKLVVGKEAILKIPIGKENSSEEHVAENIRIIIETLEHTLSKGKHNIKNILIKLRQDSGN